MQGTAVQLSKSAEGRRNLWSIVTILFQMPTCTTSSPLPEMLLVGIEDGLLGQGKFAPRGKGGQLTTFASGGMFHACAFDRVLNHNNVRSVLRRLSLSVLYITLRLEVGILSKACHC